MTPSPYFMPSGYIIERFLVGRLVNAEDPVTLGSAKVRPQLCCTCPVLLLYDFPSYPMVTIGIDYELTGRSSTAAVDKCRSRVYRSAVFTWRCGSGVEPMLTHTSATLGGPFLVGAAPLAQPF